MKTRLLLLLGCAAAWLSGFIAHAQVPAPAAETGLFITTAEQQEFVVFGKKVKRWVPGTNRLAFAWSDQPFAVHVPLQIETKIESGRVQSKPYRVSAWMQGFGTTTNYGGRSAPGVLTAGLYRFDEQPCLQGDTNRFYFHYEFDRFRGMTVLPVGDALTTNSWMPNVFLRSDLLGPARYAVWMVMDPRPRRVNERFEPDLRETERVLEVKGIPTGVWSTNETLKGVLNFVTEEVATDPSKYRPSPGEFGVPQAAAPAPAPATPGWKRTNAFDLMLKQNGWQLRSASITNNGVMAGLRSGSYEYREVESKFVPSTFTTTHRITDKSEEASKPSKTTDVRVTVTFPPRLLDHGPAWASIQMQQLGQPGGAPYDQRYGLAPDEQLTLYAHPFAPDTNTALPYGNILDNGRPKYVAFLWNTWDAITRSRDTNTGLSAETWWMKFPYGARGEGPFNTPGSGSMPGLWTADKKLEPHRLLSMDLKYWVRVAPGGAVFEKHADFFAVRLSDLEDNRSGVTVRDAPSVVAGLPDDGYFDWLARFHQQRDKTEQRLQEIGVELRALNGEQKALHSKWFKLLWLDMKSWPADPADGDDLLESVGRYLGRGLTRGRGIPMQPTIVKAVLEALKQERDGIQPKIDESRQEQAALIAEGTRISKQLVESADVQTIGSRENDQHLAEVRRTLDHMKDKHDLNRLNMYDAAGWHGTPELQQLLDEMRFSSTAARELAKIMEARGWLARAKSLDLRLAVAVISPSPVQPGSPAELDAHTARMEAMRALHEALKVAPDSIQARTLLQETELEMLGWIQRKLDHERHLSIAGFHRYLSVRGYNPGEAKGWWDGFKELNTAFWGSSPVTLGGALPWSNTAGVVADETILVQEAVAKNQVSLFAIRRLIHKKMSLKEIRNVTDDQILERLAFQTFERKELDRARARRICQDIHETFAELYDLRTLAEGDIGEFQKFIQRNYYASFDASKTWSETIGDMFFSPLGLVMMFGPSAVVKANGQWVATVPHGEIALLEEAGRLERVRDVFATTFKLEELGRRFTSTRVGGMLADAVIADQKFLASRSLLDRFLNGGSRLAAAVTIYCGAAELAEESGVPGLRLLVDAIGALGAEEMAFDILSRNGSPVRKLLAKCDEFGGVLARESAELAQLSKAHEQLEAVQKRLSARTKPGALPAPDAAELKQIEEALAVVQPPKKGTLKVAGTDKKEDAKGTLKAAAESLKKGDTAEARRALTGSKALQGEMKATLDAYDLALAKARENLNRNPALRQITATDQLKPIREIAGNPPNFAPPGGYPPGGAGVMLRHGDQAVQKGKLDEALDFYRHALHEAEAAHADDVARLIEGRLALISDAAAEAETFKILRRGPARAPPSAQALEKEHVDEMLANIAANKLEVIPNPKPSANPVYFIQGKGDKKLNFVFKALDNPDLVACEIFGPLAAHELGLSSAQARRMKMSVPQFKDGKPVFANGRQVFDEVEGFLVRAAEGKELMEMTEATILALKKDYASQRVLRLWMGDTDGHLRNILLTPEGRLLPIDFDFGSLKKDGFLRQAGRNNATQKEFLEDALGFPSLIRDRMPDHASAPLYTWLDRLDGMLSYDEMAGTVGAIQELCAEDGGKTLKEMLRKALPEEKVQEAFEALTERSGLLKEVLENKFPVFKKTAVLRFDFDRLHAAPASGPCLNESGIIALAA
ncbi:MAG: hypothetical protein WCS99_06035 [Limisphaerales bacterium]